MKYEIMKEFENISNSRLSELIDEWVKGERNRAIMKRRLIDNICFEPLAEEFDLSTRHIQRVVYKAEQTLFKHI